LSEQSITALVAGYKKYANLRFARWFVERNIKHSVSRKVIKYHGKNTIEAIIDNPYELVNFGLSLTATDQLAQAEFKIAPDDARRLVAVVSSVIKQFTTRHGHTLMHHADVKKRALKILNNDELLCKKALQVSHKSKVFVLNRHDGCYHHTPSLIMEKVVAKRLRRLKGCASLVTPVEQTVASQQINNNPFKLEEKQIEAVYSAIENHVSMLTGGAGTGKTVTLKTVLNTYHHLGYDIFPMALSGRAAMRLFEGTGYQSTTIARFLLSTSIDDESKAVIVIDEASMVDIATMYRIVTHVHPSVRFLLVGDHNQLPPVGSGLVLADMLKSAVIAAVELTVPRRFHDDTGICAYSNLIKNGAIPPNLNFGNIHFHETGEDDVSTCCSRLLATAPAHSRIIAATNAMVDCINDLAQNMVNADGEKMIINQQQYVVPE
jgi:exodeoxyribonuclease V alpha subunit